MSSEAVVETVSNDAKSGGKDMLLVVKRKEMCNDDNMIDLSLEMSPVDKKLR